MIRTLLLLTWVASLATAVHALFVADNWQLSVGATALSLVLYTMWERL